MADPISVQVELGPRYVERYPSTVYEGRPVYYYDSHWYYREGPHWAYYRAEPHALVEYRATPAFHAHYRDHHRGPAHEHHHHHHHR